MQEFNGFNPKHTITSRNSFCCSNSVFKMNGLREVDLNNEAFTEHLISSVYRDGAISSSIASSSVLMDLKFSETRPDHVFLS